MEKTLLTPANILYISLIFVLRSPGGLANMSMSAEFLLFIIPAMTAQWISLTVKIAGLSVEDEKKAFIVAISLEVIAIHQMCLPVISEMYFINLICYLMRFILICWLIGMMGFLVHKIGVMVINEKRFWARFILTYWGIVIMVFTCASILTLLQSGYVKK